MMTPFVKKASSYFSMLLLTVALTTFSACKNDDNDNTAPQLNTTDRQFMETAVRGNNAEILTSRLALTRSQDTEVRNFAQMMIDHHSTANRSLDSLARLRKVTLPDANQVDADAQALLNQLNNLQDGSGTNGPTFSRAYMLGQIQAHTKSKTEYQAYLNNSQAQDVGVRSYASKTLPVVNSHLQMAQEIANRKGYTRQ